MEKEEQKKNKEFANRIGKEISEIIAKQINDKLEKDFLKRKEENDKYFFS